MIDLSGIGRFYELKWFDGTSVWLKKPSEGMLRKIIALDKESTSITDMAILDQLKEITVGLVLDNEDGRKFPQEEIDELDAVLCSMILKDYMEFTTKRLGE